MAGDAGRPKLRIWSGDWDLPSVDPDSLSVICYAKFSKASLVLEETRPSKTVTGILPELQIEESVFTSPLNILGILRREGYNADFDLNSADHADTLAYIAMVEGKLKPGMLQNFWVDSGNYVNVTRKAYAKSFGFFQRLWHLPQIRQKIEMDLECRGIGTAAERESKLNRDAKSCITLLSQRLGAKDFFFGSAPTTFDAIAFGHLAVILKAPLVSTELKNHVTANENLCEFCGRISQRYFSKNLDGEPELGVPQKGKKEDTEAEIVERRKQYIAVGIAVVINIMYLLATGIFAPKRISQSSDLIDAEDILD